MIGLLVLPVTAGLAAMLLPAFGHLPALGRSGPDLAPLRVFLTEPGLWRSLVLTLASGLVSTLLALAGLMAFLAAAIGTRPFGMAQRLLSPLLSLPHAASAFGIALLVSPSGFAVRLFSPWATGFLTPPDWLILNDPLAITLTVALAFREFPFLLLMALAGLNALEPARRIALLQSLGYGRMSAFLFGIAPPLYRRLRLPVLAVLAYGTGNADMAMILGPTLPPLLSPRLVQLAADADLARQLEAAAGALVQLGLTLTAIVLWLLLERAAGAVYTRLAGGGYRLTADAGWRRFSWLFPVLAIGATGAGLLLLVFQSITPLQPFPHVFTGSIDPTVWARSLPALRDALVAAFALGAASAGLSTLLAFLSLGDGRISRRRAALLGSLLYFPLIVPQASFLFGLVILSLNFGLEPGIAAVFLGHMTFVLPYVLLSFAGAADQYDHRYEAVAASLGIKPLTRVLRVRLPLLLRPLLVAFAVGFAVSIGLYLPTVLLAGGRVATITTEAVALAAGGDPRRIAVLALIQALIPCLGFALAMLVPALLWRHRRAMRL